MYVIEKQVNGNTVYRSVFGGWDSRPEAALIFNVPSFAFQAAIEARKAGHAEEWRDARIRSCSIETAVWKPTTDRGFATKAFMQTRIDGKIDLFPSVEADTFVTSINEAFRVPLQGKRTNLSALNGFDGRLFIVKFQRHTIGV